MMIVSFFLQTIQWGPILLFIFICCALLLSVGLKPGAHWYVFYTNRNRLHKFFIIHNFGNIFGKIATWGFHRKIIWCHQTTHCILPDVTVAFSVNSSCSQIRPKYSIFDKRTINGLGVHRKVMQKSIVFSLRIAHRLLKMDVLSVGCHPQGMRTAAQPAPLESFPADMEGDKCGYNMEFYRNCDSNSMKLKIIIVV